LAVKTVVYVIMEYANVQLATLELFVLLVNIYLIQFKFFKIIEMFLFYLKSLVVV
jgi:hypothetical protein